jgi:hypothetical protein
MKSLAQLMIDAVPLPWEWIPEERPSGPEWEWDDNPHGIGQKDGDPFLWLTDCYFSKARLEASMELIDRTMNALPEIQEVIHQRDRQEWERKAAREAGKSTVTIDLRPMYAAIDALKKKLEGAS